MTKLYGAMSITCLEISVVTEEVEPCLKVMTDDQKLDSFSDNLLNFNLELDTETGRPLSELFWLPIETKTDTVI